MSNINFVPDDYVQSNESRRANLMCLVLFSVVMAGLGGSFMTIKIRQRACSAQEALVSAKLAKMEESIRKFEELQTRRKEMMRTALTTAELLEPVPRSVLLASLTNNLPAGVSLVKLNLIQKEPLKAAVQRVTRTKYDMAQGREAVLDAMGNSPEKSLEIQISIEGMAPSDLQVSQYMEDLGNSMLVDDVALVESTEKKAEGTVVRYFRLTARLGNEVHLTKEDIDAIRGKAEHSVYQF